MPWKSDRLNVVHRHTRRLEHREDPSFLGSLRQATHNFFTGRRRHHERGRLEIDGFRRSEEPAPAWRRQPLHNQSWQIPFHDQLQHDTDDSDDSNSSTAWGIAESEWTAAHCDDLAYPDAMTMVPVRYDERYYRYFYTADEWLFLCSLYRYGVPLAGQGRFMSSQGQDTSELREPLFDWAFNRERERAWHLWQWHEYMSRGLTRGVSRDHSQRRIMRNLRRRAIRDELNGLPNRIFMDVRRTWYLASQASRRARPFYDATDDDA
jgi:hypothetical protein